MKEIKKWLRLLYIAYIFNKYNVNKMLASIPLLKVLKLTMIFNPLYYFRKGKKDRGSRLRLTLETLGPIFISNM